MDFIFMLTHHDKTVQNCLDVYDSLSGVGLKHVGFKDVGVDKATLKELTRRIKADGSVAYVEVVSNTPETIRQSIQASAELGVDRVLGGQDIKLAMETFKGGAPTYYPFPGRSAIRPSLAARPAMSRPIAARPWRPVARASISSPIGQPMPTRSTLSARHGAG